MLLIWEWTAGISTILVLKSILEIIMSLANNRKNGGRMMNLINIILLFRKRKSILIKGRT